MHLDDDPVVISFYQNARPADVIPADGFSIPLAVVIQVTEIPGNIFRFRDIYTQIFHFKVGSFKFRIQEKGGTFFEIPVTIYKATRVGVNNEEFGTAGERCEEDACILIQSPSDGITDCLFDFFFIGDYIYFINFRASRDKDEYEDVRNN